MKKQRLSCAACFVGKAKDFVFVSGGFGAGHHVIADCEIFNVNDNMWTLFPSMKTKRASHSIMLTDNLKWIYAFGGVNENNNPLLTIERVKLNNTVDPTKDLNSEWAILRVELNDPIMNIGCYMVSEKEILVFGGMNGKGEKVKESRYFIIDNEDKGELRTIVAKGMELEEGDTFANCGNQYHPNDDTVFIFGTAYAWQISLKKDERKITKLLPLNN